MDPSRSAAARFDADLERTVDRLRGLALTRLGAPFQPEPTRADAARALVQRLADAAADLEQRPRRAVPRLADSAVGDQLAVVGRDLRDAATARGAVSELAAFADELLVLRRRL